MRQIYDLGHDIGNHSYSHRNLFNMGTAEVKRDLTSAQRVLEAQLGINTILFRAPYAQTSYGEYVAAPHVLSAASELGYLVGGIRADGFDYLLGRSANDIYKKVVEETTRADTGVTVLLHDSGGDRNAMLDALGRIIDDLSARGYRFVTTHELVGLQRDDVMPRQDPKSTFSAAAQQVRGGYLIVLARAGEIASQLAIVAVVLAMGRLLLIIVLAHVQKRREKARASTVWQPQSIAVLVPAFNEETVICKTVDSLLDSTIANRLEIIVIDDGSKDRTADVVRTTYAADPRVRVFKKENGGKSAALNFGIAQTEAEVIVAIDADTLLEPEAIERLVRHFHDPTLGAVAGNALVGNQCNLMTRMQALEYVTSQNLERRALEILNAIPVVPGAIGAWRRTALLEAGGYCHDTLAEDADLTIKLERLRWKVIYEPRARALTEAPETLSAFLKQRFRWVFGTLQVTCKNVLSPRGLPLGIATVTIPNVLVFGFAFTLLAPIIDALLIFNIASMLVAALFDTDRLESGTLALICLYWIAFQLIDVAVAWLGLRLDDDRSNMNLLPWILVQRVTYRPLLYWVAIRALLAAIKGQFVGWGKLIRTGTVTLPPAEARARGL
jgi:cellulose synthase/poly-beta-1,6-N-acetylglucosamine synthase-like glycosyltransferase